MAHYIYGKNVVRQRLLSNQKIQSLLVSQKHPNPELVDLAQKRHVPIRYLNEIELKTYGDHHQGVIAEIDDFKTYSLEELLRIIPDTATLVVLDGLEDPHNLGAILRSADASGVSGIIIPKHGSVSLNATVAKVSTGAIDTVPTCTVTNLSQTLETLKEKGYWIYGSEFTDQAQDYRSVKYGSKACLVIGSEGHGISRLVLKHCDVVVKIPMVGAINSLNASVSAALLMYEVMNQRFPLIKQ